MLFQKNIATILHLAAVFCTAKAQDAATVTTEKSKITTCIGLAGRVLFFTGFNDNYYFNMGGPNIAADYGTWKVSLHMMPSLRYNTNLTSKVMPTLGVGPQLAYKWATVGLGFYYLGEKEKWTANLGLGVRLAKSG